MSRYCLFNLSQLDEALAGAERILIAADFDGTLCAIAESPEHAVLTPAMAGILRTLRQSPRIVLAVISGRALADVALRVPYADIIAGNHGLEIRGDGIAFRHPEADLSRPCLERACNELRQLAERWPGAWVEDKQLTATLHFRKVDVAHHQELMRAARGRISQVSPALGMRAGRKALEIHPRVGWDKGSALQYIQLKTGCGKCLAIGDDRTDEAMFRANSTGINVRIGSGNGTAAKHHLSDPAEVALLLAHIVGLSDRPVVEPGPLTLAAL